MSDFVLTPPLAIRAGIAVSLIQVGDMDAPEALVMDIGSWGPIDLLSHWHSEVGAILDGKRDHGCIVSGLAVEKGELLPTEWWTMFVVDSDVRFQYQVLNIHDEARLGGWGRPDKWWGNMPDYSRFSDDGDGTREVSEWAVAIDSLVHWHQQCGALIRAAQSVEDEIDT